MIFHCAESAERISDYIKCIFYSMRNVFIHHCLGKKVDMILSANMLTHC